MSVIAECMLISGVWESKTGTKHEHSGLEIFEMEVVHSLYPFILGKGVDGEAMIITISKYIHTASWTYPHAFIANLLYLPCPVLPSELF